MFENPEESGTPVARAYVYNGEWVGDCPGRCGNVEFLYQSQQINGPRVLRRPFFLCSYCGLQTLISWPDNEHDILAALMKRPAPSNRNWYPTDHPVAVNFKIPHGQSVEDLLAENEEHGVSR